MEMILFLAIASINLWNHRSISLEFRKKTTNVQLHLISSNIAYLYIWNLMKRWIDAYGKKTANATVPLSWRAGAFKSRLI